MNKMFVENKPGRATYFNFFTGRKIMNPGSEPVKITTADLGILIRSRLILVRQ